MTRSEILVKALLSLNILVTLLKKKKKERKPERKVKTHCVRPESKGSLLNNQHKASRGPQNVMEGEGGGVG